MFSSPEASACRVLPVRAASTPEPLPVPPIGTEPTAEDVIVATHRLTYSDRLKVFIGPHEDVDSFLRPLRRLDGHQRYALDLTVLPDPMPATEVTTAVSTARGDLALQCAGSADAMTLQLRRTVDHVTRRFTLGFGGNRLGLPTVYLPHGDEETYVYPEEVFTAELAAEVFRCFFHRGTVPGELAHREILD
ncbi:hypothetical protein FEK33_07475 [Nocardia asteroides NBRC 15531]|uniref:Uncharacterized protein n=1 Tax=Nocardia asteroides NBRC 15531 TaxID=1110697 RepID=U5ED23_NOCAS|nr:hypothetical protein [Nocardia asteroides]TLF70069.1 hypothetical protein FEK33_07475 [Nocardia asteroides NBRC 15531]UGT49596.1 hypothetical protein LT345_02965 [Nocardia asteroides]SFL95569.1 hypothetical protein SAMN05444423_1011518 [Nocardia asteroides]VEG37740.1 Uncharacterised protein [Nocardia asteroides]GAD84316.1 hypothetical protein NCAST_23_00740 [Nocardia asteroides NBRC 15531]